MSLSVEWDPEKEARNLSKHGVGFDEAATVLTDPLSITLPDPDHSDIEERLLLLGRSARDRPLIVALTERGDTVRIISARLMTPRERKTYELASRS